jgi:hypothetical protein
MIEVNGHATRGMCLRDLRNFVARTEGLKDSVWVDCRIPGEAEGSTVVAALMGLMCADRD